MSNAELARCNWVAFQTILYKEVSRVVRIWVQTLVPPAITMTLYFIIFGNLVGSRIGQMGGFSYMEYITPGIIMMSVITNSYGNVVSSFFGSKFQHHVEELLVAPISNNTILIGYIAGGVARGLLVGIIVTIISLFFVQYSLHSIGITMVVVLLTAILFSLAGFINAMFARSFDDISIVPTFVLTPMTYLGGVFYSISMLPEFWQTVSMVNPILYMVNAFRYGFLGVSDIALVPALSLTVGFIVLLYLWASYLLNKGVGLKN